MIMKLKLTIAYDGTNYKGWQMQKTGISIQQKVEDAFRNLFPSMTSICGCSRTDAGVHALGMVAHVELSPRRNDVNLHKVPLAINAFLPDDIRIVNVEKVPLYFHARFDCIKKRYCYKMWNHRTANPLLRAQTWHVPVPLDLRLMCEAASYFVGQHDFFSFSANSKDVEKDTIRRLFRCEVRQLDSLFMITLEGDGFLYKMCRAIVGALCRVGHKKLDVKMISTLLSHRSKGHMKLIAPAHGLTLLRVFYQKKDYV